MVPEQYHELRRLMRNYKIFFDGPVEPAKWPIAHGIIFGNIRKLGPRRYDDY